jgi:hypothetical protein
VISFLLVSPLKLCMHSCSPPCLLHALPISSSLTWRYYLYHGVRVISWD